MGGYCLYILLSRFTIEIFGHRDITSSFSSFYSLVIIILIIITEDFDQSLKTLKDALELKKDIGDDTDDEGKKALSLLHFNLGSLLLEYRNKLSSTTGKEVAESIENFTKAKELLVAIGYKSDHPEVQGIGKLVYIFLCLCVSISSYLCNCQVYSHLNHVLR